MVFYTPGLSDNNKVATRAPKLVTDFGCLASEPVDGSSLALEGVDDVERGDGLAAGVLGVGDGVTDDGLEEGLQDAAALLVDESRNALDSSTAGETTDGGLGDSLDVVPEDLAMALGSALAESLSSLAASRHVLEFSCT